MKQKATEGDRDNKELKQRKIGEEETATARGDKKIRRQKQTERNRERQKETGKGRRRGRQNKREGGRERQRKGSTKRLMLMVYKFLSYMAMRSILGFMV